MVKCCASTGNRGVSWFRRTNGFTNTLTRALSPLAILPYGGIVGAIDLSHSPMRSPSRSMSSKAEIRSNTKTRIQKFIRSSNRLLPKPARLATCAPWFGGVPRKKDPARDVRLFRVSCFEYRVEPETRNPRLETKLMDTLLAQPSDQ